MLKRIAFALCVVLLAISCGQGETRTVQKSDLLHAVPVDAKSVCILENCASECVNELQLSTLPLDLSLFKAQKAVLSKVDILGDYTLMVLDVTGTDPQTAIQAIRDSGCACQMISSDQGYEYGTALLVCESEMAIRSSLNNLSSNTSILDAQGFNDALQSAPNADVIVIKKGVWNKSQVCQWTVITDCIKEEYNLTFYAPDSYSYLSNVLDELPAGESQLGLLIPSDADWVLDLTIEDAALFNDLRYRNLDALVQLTKAEGVASSLKKKYGMTPLDWARKNSISEAAIVRWGSDSRKVVLLRSTQSGVSHKVKPNKQRGYSQAFLGDMFVLGDDSSVACLGYWKVIGSKDDVTEFLKCENRGKSFSWPQKDIKLAVFDTDRLVVIEKNGAKLHLNCE